ncbi:hypothetical protein [Aliiroseovarius crassostreae]|uniref:Uncharacterized protein n=1 Tax=Aliiroseovarius crassostreae TaxID=154981 RepID=A0A9Q9HDH7_9RHOB|nr:hypothetical protein [Aliiroseovarius crassostreae]UWP89566.1 hypothetical protein K3J57_02355 [Aliiroseovarius crassostreae]UWP95846.1 hypothetical protein K3X48_02260 [Aliiroseovarius crassostreae]UWP99017.1 hypothetical protein K3X53_02305 [Aliiroseovarius crassostreae]
MIELLTHPNKARATGSRRVVFHADTAWMNSIEAQEHPIFDQIQKAFARRSIPVQRVRLDSPAAAKVLDDPDAAHIMLGDNARFGSRILHLWRAPVWGFWHLDELGAGWQSALRLSEFDASSIDEERATYFFNGVTGYMLRENVSLSVQEERMHGSLQGAKATVFCQASRDDDAQSCYLSSENMIRITAEFDPKALVYVKLDPAIGKDQRRRIMAITQDYQNVRLTDASVHDLVEASDLTVTQNATQGFEALMQKCPVIYCAKSPYWQAALTAKTAGDLREALEFGTLGMFDFPYEKYFYWALVRHGLEPAKEVFVKRFMARFYDKVMWR